MFSQNRLLFILLISILFTGFTVKGQAPVGASGSAMLAPQGYQYEATKCNDTEDGIQYYFLQNDSLFVSVAEQDNANNQRGGQHAGGVMDVINKPGAKDNLDWCQFLISNSMHSSWDRPNANPQMTTLSADVNQGTVSASGYATDFPNLKMEVDYSLLQNAPILKISVRVINEGATNFNGFVEYQIDPEGGYESSWESALGSNFGLATSGWSSNYMMTGIPGDTAVNSPYHGLAWFEDQPTGLLGYSYLNGVWFSAACAAGDTAEFALYHISDIPTANYNVAEDCIKQWVDRIQSYDPALAGYDFLNGRVEASDTTAVANATVKIRNINADLVAQVNTNANGEYEAFIPQDVYTVTVSALGYQLQSRSIDLSVNQNLDFTVAENAALQPQTVFAGTGKSINAQYQGIATDDDILMENENIAVAISVVTPASQLDLASRGTPIDVLIKGNNTDYLDWLEMSKITTNPDELEEWWSEMHVYNDSVFVVNDGTSGDSAVVRTIGRYFRKYSGGALQNNEVLETKMGQQLAFRTDLDIINTYTILPGTHHVEVRTLYNNNSGTVLDVDMGDVMDLEGGEQKSYIPGYGSVEGTPSSHSGHYFNKNAPWFCQYTNDDPVVGIIYVGEYADSALGYATNRWASLRDNVQIPASGQYSLQRKLVIRDGSSFPFKPDAIAGYYNQLVQQNTGLTVDVTVAQQVHQVGDTIWVDITLTNSNPNTIQPITLELFPQSNIQAIGFGSTLLIDSIPANSTEFVQIPFLALSGGRGNSLIQVTDHMSNLFEYKFKTSITGPGWYMGDNHTHSVHSDGVGTIAQNVASGYAKGLSFMTATDHNTLSQKPNVDHQNNLYEDLIVMTGEEVTTSQGHALAYNTGALIPWNLNQYTQQEIIDSVLNCTTQYGQGYIFFAHPHYPGLPWTNYDLVGHRGLEVWNGFYHATHNVNQATFQDWDMLNNQGEKLFGISNSDAHNPDKVAANYIVAYLEDLTKQEIVSAIRDKGCFYGSNGPRLNFEVEGKRMGSDVAVPASGRNVSIDIWANSQTDLPLNAIRLFKNGQVIQSWSTQTQDTTLHLLVPVVIGDHIRLEVEAGAGFAYSNPIWFEGGSNNGNIDSVYIEESLYAPFDQQIHNYVYSSHVDSMPMIEVFPADSNAIVQMQLPVDVLSADSNDRKAYFTVFSEDRSVANSYEILFNEELGNIDIDSVRINGTRYSSFDQNIIAYTFPDFVDSVNQLEVFAINPNASVTIQLPVDVLSNDSLDRMAYFTIVSADSFATETYSIFFNPNLRNIDIDSVYFNGMMFEEFDMLQVAYQHATHLDSIYDFIVYPADTQAFVNIQLPQDVLSNDSLDRMAYFTITSADSLATATYSIWFNPNLRNIHINQVSINQTVFTAFDENQFLYTYPTYVNSITEWTVQTQDSLATVQIQFPNDVQSLDSTDRVGSFVITSADGLDSAQYSVFFNPNFGNAHVSSVKVNDSPFSSFDVSTSHYVYPTFLAQVDSIPVITEDPNAIVQVTLPIQVTSLDSADRTAHIHVESAHGGIVREYWIHFNYNYGNTLIDSLKVNDSIFQDFHPDSLNYLFAGHLPQLDSIPVYPADPNAAVQVDMPVDILSIDPQDRIAQVTITSAHGGFQKTYIILFNDLYGNTALTQIKVNDSVYSEFNLDSSFQVYPHFVSSVDSIPVTLLDPEASVQVQLPIDVLSADSLDRLATLTITSAYGGYTKTYSLFFNDNLGNVFIDSVYINGQNFEAFHVDSSSFVYPVQLNANPTILVYPNDPNADIQSQPLFYLFSLDSTDRSFHFDITSADQTAQKSYSILFNADLNASNYMRLFVNGTQYSSFVPNETNYLYADSLALNPFVEAIPYSSAMDYTLTQVVDVYSADSVERSAHLSVFNGLDYQEYRIEFSGLDTSSTAGLNFLIQNELILYPNPASEVLHISSNVNLAQCTWMIVDNTGKQIKSGKVEKKEDQNLPIHNLAQGTYFIHIQTTGGQVIRQKFTKINP